jgi:hypothetical protein
VQSVRPGRDEEHAVDVYATTVAGVHVVRVCAVDARFMPHGRLAVSHGYTAPWQEGECRSSDDQCSPHFSSAYT